MTLVEENRKTYSEKDIKTLVDQACELASENLSVLKKSLEEMAGNYQSSFSHIGAANGVINGSRNVGLHFKGKDYRYKVKRAGYIFVSEEDMPQYAKNNNEEIFLENHLVITTNSCESVLPNGLRRIEIYSKGKEPIIRVMEFGHFNQGKIQSSRFEFQDGKIVRLRQEVGSGVYFPSNTRRDQTFIFNRTPNRIGEIFVAHVGTSAREGHGLVAPMQRLINEKAVAMAIHNSSLFQPAFSHIKL